jgi:hypothetical protein
MGGTSSSSSPSPSWDAVERELAGEARLAAVEVSERTSIYQEYIQDVKNRLERHRREQHKIATEHYVAYLQRLSHDDDNPNVITSKTAYEEVARLQQPEPLDEATTTGITISSSATNGFAILTDHERRSIFADFIRDLKETEMQRLHDQQREERRRQAEAKRTLLQHLHDLAEAERIVPATTWEAARQLLPEDVMAAPPPTSDEDRHNRRPHHHHQYHWAKQVFQEFVQQWGDDYRRDRQVLVRLLPSRLDHLKEMSYDDFSRILQEEASYLSSHNNEPELRYSVASILTKSDSARLYLRELTGRLNHNVMATTLQSSTTTATTAAAPRRAAEQAESSEDEGQVVEDDDELEET